MRLSEFVLTSASPLARATQPIALSETYRTADLLRQGRSGKRFRRSGDRLMELDVALLLNAGLLDRHHLALQVGQLGRGWTVTLDQESGRPKDYDCYARRDLVASSLVILSAGNDGSA